jgi:hypothetical protein
VYLLGEYMDIGINMILWWILGYKGVLRNKAVDCVAKHAVLMGV